MKIDGLTPIEALKTPMLIAGVVGAAGLALTALGALANSKEALFSYLFAFVYWLTFSLGALFTQTIFHAAHARWPIVFRRPLEWLSIACLVFIPLFIPLALGLGDLYVWVSPSQDLGERALKLLEHKHGYLNVGFFLIRAVLYFSLWGAVAWLLHRWSVAQDVAPDARVIGWQRNLSAGVLPFLALSISFAALDWVMSLEPLFGSTLFGVYIFAGSMVAVLSTLAITAAFVRGSTTFGNFVTGAHYNRLGTLLLGFVCFWGYCAYSQGMLIWIAGLPIESQWLLIRTHAGWAVIAVVLIVFHFAVPFLLLLNRSIKKRGRRLGFVATGLLAVHALDLYWVIFPALHPDTPHFHWTTLTAFLGIGGAMTAFTLWHVQGKLALPVNAPYLAHSLEVPLS
jgi:hypothetical protein